MLYPRLEDDLRDAKKALQRATSENLEGLCREYLALLFEYRSEIYKLHGTPVINLSAGPLSSEDVEKTRKEVRLALEDMTKERVKTTTLLTWITTVSGYQAANTFNRLKYEGHSDWEMRSSGVGLSGETNSNILTVQEAVDMAKLLRREEYTTKIHEEVEKFIIA